MLLLPLLLSAAACRHKLNGCVNDVRAMHSMLSDHFGFEEFTVLIDTDPSSEQPTGANIKVCVCVQLRCAGGPVQQQRQQPPRQRRRQRLLQQPA